MGMSEEVKAALRARAAEARKLNPKPGDFPLESIHMAIDHAKEQGLGLEEDRLHLCVNEEGEYEGGQLFVDPARSRLANLEASAMRDAGWGFAAYLRWAVGLNAILAKHLPHAVLMFPAPKDPDWKAPRLVRAYRWRTLHAVIKFLVNPTIGRGVDWTPGGRYVCELSPRDVAAGMMRYTSTRDCSPSAWSMSLADADLSALQARRRHGR